MSRLSTIAFTLAAMLCATPALTQGASVGFGGGDHNSAAPVEVNADTLEVDQETGQAVLAGNVVIIQDALRLSADRVTVDYAEASGKREILALNASGDVLIVSGPDAAEGAEATYTLASGVIVMTGDVLVTQGNNTLAGNSLTIDLDTGQGTVSGRVRTILLPTGE